MYILKNFTACLQVEKLLYTLEENFELRAKFELTVFELTGPNMYCFSIQSINSTDSNYGKTRLPGWYFTKGYFTQILYLNLS